MAWYKFRAPVIRQATIWREVEKFRKSFWSSGELPVDIERIVEFELRLEIRPISGLMKDCNTDALLLGNRKTIIIDTEMYMDDRMQNRVRYSLAHEVGHWVLHPNVYSRIAHASGKEWIRFYREIPEDQYKWMEQHAYEFAGRLLVPRDKLVEEFEKAKLLAEKSGFTKWESSGDAAREYIAHSIARIFGVSEQVVAKRLLREELLTR